jgi:hypothetical protein
MPEPNFIKLGMYIMVRERISVAYLKKILELVCVSLCVSPPHRCEVTAQKPRSRGKEYTQQQKKYYTSRFLCRPCRIRRESVGMSMYLHITATQRLGKNVPAAMMNYWRLRFLYGPCHIKGN